MSTLPQHNRRHIHYVDHTLQKWLLLALVLMEALLASLALWVLYQALDTVIDEEMYRVHYSSDTQVLPLLLREGARVLGWMLLANGLALLAADRIWAWFVQRILKKLKRLMQSARQLDLRPHEDIRGEHSVLAQALHWRQVQAQRLADARTLVATLPATLPASPEERAELTQRLERWAAQP